MENSISQKFTTKSLLKFVVPPIIMMVFCATYSMMASVFAGLLINEYALSATNIVFPVISAVLAIAIMFATGSTAIIAKNMGEKKLQTARENFTYITIMGFVIGLFITLISLYMPDKIIAMLGSSGIQDSYSLPYLISIAPFFPFVFFQIFTQYFFISIGKPDISMGVIFIGGILSIITSYVLVTGFGLGIIGIAIGMGISYLIPSIIFVSYFSINRKGGLYFVSPKRHKAFIMSTVVNGSSEMVTNIAISITIPIMNFTILQLEGDIGIVAVSVIMQVQFLLESIFIGLAAGVEPILAYANGAKDQNQITNVYNISKKIIVRASLVLVLICLIFTDPMVNLFVNRDSSAFELTKEAFRLFSFAYLFAGMNIFASAFFTSMSNGKISAFISFMRAFVFIVASLILLPNIIGAKGVWLAVPLAEFFAVFISILFLKSYKKNHSYSEVDISYQVK